MFERSPTVLTGGTRVCDKAVGVVTTYAERTALGKRDCPQMRVVHGWKTWKKFSTVRTEVN